MNTAGRYLALLTSSLALALPVSAQSPTPFEAPPVLVARDLAPADWLAGPDFTVDETVPTDGFYGIFTVRGQYGAVQAHGLAMLRVRVGETQALARLKETSRREAVVAGAVDSAEQTVQSATLALQDPVGTVEAVPASVGRLFCRLGSKVEKRVGRLSGSEDASAPLGEREEIARERRALAKQLGVDPYTDNPLLSSNLDQVAKWKRHGELALGFATGSMSLFAGVATKTVDLVCSQPPEEVRSANQKRLTALTPAASPEDIRSFLNNPAFTPTTQTILVDQIESFPVKAGRESLVRLAGQMDNHDQARFLIAATRLLTAYHERVASLSSVESRGLLAVGLAPDGTLVVPVPVDCLAWTDRLVGFGNRSDLHETQREILITGIVTPRTRHELSALGWTLRERFSAAPTAEGTAH